MYALTRTFKQVPIHYPARGVFPPATADDFPTVFPPLVLMYFFHLDSGSRLTCCGHRNPSSLVHRALRQYGLGFP